MLRRLVDSLRFFKGRWSKRFSKPALLLLPLLLTYRVKRLLRKINFRLLMSLGTACVDSVFCSVTYFCESSGAASGDPFVPFDFIASFLLAPPVATQFSVVRAPPVATLRQTDGQTGRPLQKAYSLLLFSFFFFWLLHISFYPSYFVYYECSSYVWAGWA